MKESEDYATLKIPKELADEIDKIVGLMGFRSRAEFVKEAIRKLLMEYKEKPPLEHFNLNENGVVVIDRIAIPNRDLYVQIYFKPEGILCEYHNSSNCYHIKYALSKPDIQKVIQKHRKEGWKLPDPDKVETGPT